MNRRDFLKGAAALGCVVRLPGAAGADREAGMYVSLNGSLTGGKPAWPEFARLAARVGFGGVDVNLGAARKEGLEATRALFDELKIKASNTGLPVPFSRDEDGFQTGLKTLDEAARFSGAIHCPTMLGILPPASPTPKTELRKILKDRLTAVAEILQRSK